MRGLRCPLLLPGLECDRAWLRDKHSFPWSHTGPGPRLAAPFSGARLPCEEGRPAPRAPPQVHGSVTGDYRPWAHGVDSNAAARSASLGWDRQHRVCGVPGRRAGDHIGDCVRGCGRRVHCGDAEVAIELRYREVGAGAGAGGGEADLAGPVAGRGDELVDGGDAGLRAGDEYVGLAGERSDGNEVPAWVVQQLACGAALYAWALVLISSVYPSGGAFATSAGAAVLPAPGW